MTYPKYYKGRAFHAKVISKRLSLWVDDDKIEVEKVDMQPYIEDMEYKEITEHQFIEKYNKTDKYLKSLI